MLSILTEEMSQREIMEKLGLKDRMHFSRKYLEPALDNDLIEMTIPDKPNSRLQKYRLTAKGEAEIKKCK